MGSYLAGVYKHPVKGIDCFGQKYSIHGWDICNIKEKGTLLKNNYFCNSPQGNFVKFEETYLTFSTVF